MPGSRPIVLGAVLLLAVLEASFSHPSHAGDLAVREHRGMYGLNDAASGNFVVEPKDDYAWDFDDGKTRVRLDDGSTLLIDPEGKCLDKP